MSVEQVGPNCKGRSDAVGTGLENAGSGSAHGAYAGGDESGDSQFKILLRSLRVPDSAGTTFAGPSVIDAVRAALAGDVSGFAEPVLRWAGATKLVAIDIDRPEGTSPIRDEDIASFFPESLPRPAAAWRTHGGGLRGLFVEVDGVDALQIAGAWALLAPLGVLAGWRMEAKTDSRHPGGDRGEERCGDVLQFAPTANVFISRGHDEPVAAEDEISVWLGERRLSFGRHSHAACPWCSSDPGYGNPPVKIDERGVTCFKCERCESWDQILDRGATVSMRALYDAARNLVHFPHQQLVLRELRPDFPAKLLAPAWRFMLCAANVDRLRDSDPDRRAAFLTRVELAASTRIDVVRSASGAWLDAQTLQARKLTATGTLREMPWVRSGTMSDAALGTGPLRGFVGIAPLPANAIIAPGVEPPEGAIFVRRPRDPRDAPPIDLGDRPPTNDDVESAWAALEQSLPGLHRGFLEGLILACLVAQHGDGLPPIIVATGKTGRAKTTQVHLAAASTGRRAGMITLGDVEDTRRKIGLALEDGKSPLFADEVGRTPRLYERLETILALNSELPFRAKYANERDARVTAPIVLLGSTLPYAVTRSPELARRAVGWRLLDRADAWERHGDLARARRHESLRPHLDLIMAAIWWRLADAGTRAAWRDLCLTELGAVPLEELELGRDAEGRAEAVRELYEIYRTAGSNQLHDGSTYRGWLVANPGTPAWGALLELVDVQGDARAREAERHELERLDLADVLGFDRPRLVLSIRQRSARWLVAFQEEGVLKGRGTPRDRLPPASRLPRDAARWHACTVTTGDGDLAADDRDVVREAEDEEDVREHHDARRGGGA